LEKRKSQKGEGKKKESEGRKGRKGRNGGEVGHMERAPRTMLWICRIPVLLYDHGIAYWATMACARAMNRPPDPH